jgi:hypothetical protein
MLIEPSIATIADHLKRQSGDTLKRPRRDYSRQMRGACCSVFLLSFWTLQVPARGDDFRVSTRVFVGEQTQPAGENLTLFVGDKVYDFMERAPREITAFDAHSGEFDLIDPSRKIWSSLSMDELLRFTAQLKVRAAANERLDRVVRAAANPDFTATYDAAEKQLALRSPAMTYLATGVSLDASQAAKYHRFCDAFCQLNSTRPGALPPFARLELNRQLSDKGVVPGEIMLRLAPRRAGETPTVLRSKHEFSTRLTDAARERIAAARAQTAEFAWVPFHQYRGISLQVGQSTPDRR